MQNLPLFSIEIEKTTLELANLLLKFSIAQSNNFSDLDERIAKIKIVGNYSEEQLKAIITGIQSKTMTTGGSSNTILAYVEHLLMQGESFERIKAWLDTTDH